MAVEMFASMNDLLIGSIGNKKSNFIYENLKLVYIIYMIYIIYIIYVIYNIYNIYKYTFHAYIYIYIYIYIYTFSIHIVKAVFTCTVSSY